MKHVDYLIVGFGLAGMAFCDQLEQNSKTFCVLDNKEGAASRVAAGLINPVTLKRYTMPWKGEEQFDLAVAYFERLSEKLGVKAITQMPVYKLFSSVEDQNDWFEASDRPILKRFLNPDLIKDGIDGVQAPLHFGEVLETLRIDIPLLLDAYADLLIAKTIFKQAKFEHEEVVFEEDGLVRYKDIVAKRVVFAEGYGIKENPFFNKLPLVGNKGEYLIIEAPDLKISEALKASFFIIPIGKNLYKVGATFNWKDKDLKPTSEAREELLLKLKNMINCDFSIVDQEVGIRPTTADRRPLTGVHPKYPQLAILNGLGTRGTMMSPYLAAQLYNHLENGANLEEESSILRFPKKF